MIGFAFRTVSSASSSESERVGLTTSDHVRSLGFEFGYGVREVTDYIVFEVPHILFGTGGDFMEIDEEKVDGAVLALLYLTTFKDKPNWRAWKGHDWDSLDRLHHKGYISDPATKAKSVWLSEEGAKRSRDLFEKCFTKIGRAGSTA